MIILPNDTKTNLFKNGKLLPVKSLDDIMRLLENRKFKNDKTLIKAFEIVKSDIKNINANNITLQTAPDKDMLKYLKKTIDDIENLLKDISKNKLAYPKNSTEIKELANMESLVKKSLDTLKDIFYKASNILSQSHPEELNDIIKQAIQSKNHKIIKLLNNTKILSKLQNLTTDLDDIVSLLKKGNQSKKQIDVLKNFTLDLKNIHLENNIKNSGIFFESNLKSNLFDRVKIDNDLKNALYSIKELAVKNADTQLESKVQKSISHIETLQLNSIANSNITLFIPFKWDDLENGNIIFKNSSKKNYSCKIDLELKKSGKIEIFILLESNNISIGIDAKNKEFEKQLKQKSKILEEMLKGINLRANIFFHKQNKNLYNDCEDINLGMDIKI